MAAGIAESQITIVNNGSTDGTVEFLKLHPQLRVIHNAENRGCGFAWSQGSKASSALWTIVLNNDVLVPSGCIEGMIDAAIEKNCGIVCPAMCEGEADYDWQTHGIEFMNRMRAAHRLGATHGVCFMVHRRVFEAIGYFDEDPKLGGYEDDEFFCRARRSGIRLMTTGRAFLHHFGSITQKSMKAEQGQQADVKAAKRKNYYRQKYKQTWFARKQIQLRDKLLRKWWMTNEKLRFGSTLKERRVNKAFEPR